MTAPMGEEFNPPTQPVRRPRRESAYETLYSPPPTHTSSSGANSMRPCCGGESRSMHSPRLTRSYLQSFGSRIFIESKNVADFTFLCEAPANAGQNALLKCLNKFSDARAGSP